MADGNLGRRNFLKTSLLAAAPIAVPATKWVGGTPQPSPDRGLTVYQDGPQIWVRWAGRPLTCYRAHATQKYPYFYPFMGPKSGQSVTEESGTSFPHHRSILFACDQVNGGTYWQNVVTTGQISSKGPKIGPVTPQSAEILDHCEWNKPEQAVVMTDSRRFVVTRASDDLRYLDATIDWQAVQDVTINKTNHALFSVRAASDLAPWGGGRLENSNGKVGASETFSKPAAWCTFYGHRAGLPADMVEGVALMQHPENPWKDCPWFTRDYGFMSPQPFNFQKEPWRLAAGKSVKLRFRIVAYFGTPKSEDLTAIYREWIRG